MALPLSVADWPEDWLFLCHERAGIMEFQGNLPRAEAERRAAEDIRRQEAAGRVQGDAQ